MVTCSPERGLRPTRGGRRLIEKLPKPRISMRCPRARASDIASRTVLTANSVSRTVICVNRSASCATRSDRVMAGSRATGRPWPAAHPPGGQRAWRAWGRSSSLFVAVVELGAQQGAQARGAGVLALVGRRDALHGFLLVDVVLGLDRQLDRARLAIDVDDHGGDFVAFLQHVARVFDAVAADFGSTQVAGDVVVELDLGAARVDGLDLADHDCATVVDRGVVRERVAVELLDAQR